MPTPEESPLEFLRARGKAAKRARPTMKKAAAPGETFSDRGGRVCRYVIPKKLGMAEESDLEVHVASGSNIVNIEISEDGIARIAK
jgi:hypothetical protein